MTHLMISATFGEQFRRCGRNWPKAGRVISVADLSDKDLARLKSEPMLHVRQATDAERRDTGGAADERETRITEAIASLTADDFQRDGRPKLDSLNAVLGDDLGRITGAERDQVFDAMKESGFEAPKATDLLIPERKDQSRT